MNKVSDANKENSNPFPSKNANSLKSNNSSKNSVQTKKIRRTLSYINLKRKRAAQFCTVNKTNGNRRLSLNFSRKTHPKCKTTRSNSLEDSFSNSLPTEEEALKVYSNTLPNRRFSHFNPTSTFSTTSSSSSSSTLEKKKNQKFKSLKFHLKKRNNYEATLQILQKQTLFDIDQRLKDYIQNQPEVSMDSSYENEELNNKIDLEIRILDGILKLLNAICSTSSLPQTNQNPANPNGSNQNGANAAQNSAASLLISNLDMNSLDGMSKCSTVGAEIAAAIMTNRLPSEASGKTNAANGYIPYTNSSSGSTSSSSTVSSLATSALNVTGTDSTDSIFQILSACKCLYVSHRKIAIYLQNLQELEKKNLQNSANGKHKKINLGDLVSTSENALDNDDKLKIDRRSKDNKTLKKAPFTSAQKPKAPLANVTLNLKNDLNITKPHGDTAKSQNSIVEFNTTKIMLKDIRIPLVWKWNDHLKAIKNSENASVKFATFAIIHLGNMIYDTQLISNIDPSITDISFNETFIFDDVKQNDFEITIEFYSYELFNTANNILQSAKKLAKQLTDFATFKRNGNNTSQLQQQQSIASFNTLPSQPNGNSSNNYSYSMHKFKLIARANLTAKDISEDVETKPLQIINESSLDQTCGNSSNSSNGNLNVQNQNNSAGTLSSSTSSVNAATTKLPLFDFYSCCLTYAPTSTYI